MTDPDSDSIARARNEQAALWCLRDAEGELDESGHLALEQWLRAEPANAAAFSQARWVWQEAEAAVEAPEMIRLRARAVELLHTVTARDREYPDRKRRFAMFGVAASVAVAMVAGAMAWYGGAQVYRTGVGERRVVMLADGTRMTLDGATEVDVRLERDRRRLVLVSGRAKFDVAHDPLRPLSVLAANRLTVATGTAFSVELLKSQMRVILYQGKVEVMDGRRDHRPLDAIAGEVPEMSLTAGNELTAARNGPAVRIDRTDTERSLTWESGMLTFVNEPLATAIERMNRGTTSKLIVGDAATGNYRISGDFTEGDMDAFVEGIGAIYDARVTPGVDGNILHVQAKNKKVFAPAV